MNQVPQNTGNYALPIDDDNQAEEDLKNIEQQEQEDDATDDIQQMFSYDQTFDLRDTNMIAQGLAPSQQEYMIKSDNQSIYNNSQINQSPRSPKLKK